ncbi:MAG TPA: hypothetical protein PLH56_05525 [Candidatus Omnitrophota bacterium]|nr:hypothetical protein [Candidatus Omnitrophota bacterium]
MDIEALWNKALKETEILRSRIQALKVFSETRVPYILLSESSVNLGDTVVRRGEVVIEKPSLVVPPLNPFFEGFDFDGEEKFNDNNFINFLLIRGITLPSFHYDNKTHSLDIFEGKLSGAIKNYQKILQEQENTHSGLIAGPEDCWQFSLLIFICAQIARNADNDIRKLLEKYHEPNN